MKKKAVKLLSILLAAALLVCASVGGTLAWLSAKTQTVTNTFTVGNIDITLEETKGTGDALAKSYKMVPGGTIEKDPKVTVLANSEDCYLFVKIEESTNLDNFIAYAIADGWTALDDNDGVYYRTVTASDADQPFAVLKDNQVTVKSDVTKDMMDEVGENKPTLSFTAYAVQSANLEVPAGQTMSIEQFAWEQAQTATNP